MCETSVETMPWKFKGGGAPVCLWAVAVNIRTVSGSQRQRLVVPWPSVHPKGHCNLMLRTVGCFHRVRSDIETADWQKLHVLAGQV